MDLLFWRKVNPVILCEATRKVSYSKYLYRVDILAPGCKLINTTDDPSVYEDKIQARLAAQKLNRQGWYHARQQLIDADCDLLTELKRFIESWDHIKTRIEEPSIQFYAETEDELQGIARAINPKWHSRISRVTMPRNDEQAALLLEGKLLVSDRVQYKYKVNMRDGRYSPEVRAQIKSYLDGLGTDVVSYGKGTRDHLEARFDTMWGCFFYTNDSSILTFLSLIAPSIIGKIQEVVVVV
jgi:hypothetical protein